MNFADAGHQLGQMDGPLLVCLTWNRATEGHIPVLYLNQDVTQRGVSPELLVYLLF